MAGSLQRGQPRLSHDRGVIPYLDETQIDQRSQIIIPDRRQFEPIAKDVARIEIVVNAAFRR